MAAPPQASPPSLDPTRQAKRELRATCRQARDQLGEAFRVRASEQICERIRQWAGFPSEGVIFTYLPMRGEVDLRPLIEVAGPGACWAIPRVVDKPVRQLTFHLYDPERLIRHRYGMLEPGPTLPTIAADQADLILVPGLAFTRTGYRLGYGGGYYDRLLASHGHAPTLGACFQALLVDEIPHERHDVTVEYLVTEVLSVVTTRPAA